jgi:hypothetical protein
MRSRVTRRRSFQLLIWINKTAQGADESLAMNVTAQIAHDVSLAGHDLVWLLLAWRAAESAAAKSAGTLSNSKVL